MTQFRKKPVEVEARQFDGTFEHACQLREWIGVNASAFCDSLRVDPPIGHIEIRTLEGAMRAEPFDWIIRGVKGEFYPCKPAIFAVTYESVDLSASPCAQETPPEDQEAALGHDARVQAVHLRLTQRANEIKSAHVALEEAAEEIVDLAESLAALRESPPPAEKT